MSLAPRSKVLVTGAAGFIGSNLVKALNDRGLANIIVADCLGTDGRWRNIEPLAFADYIDAGLLLDALDSGKLGDFDLVLHMGACSSTTERDAAYLMRNNYEYTKRLAHWSLDHDARFVYASSAATYGNGDAGMDDAADPATLRSYHPLNMYGYSKHVFDLYAAQNNLFDRITGLKYFNVFGPNEAHKGDMRSMVLKAWEQIRDNGAVRLFRSYREEFADGEQRRDFIYVKDAVAMTLHLAGLPTATGLYNVGSGRAETWIDLARAVFAAMKLEPRIEFIDMPEEMRAAYQYHTVADIHRLKETGYGLEITSLRDAVADYVMRYLSSDSIR
jgi:ADP-L-glycero-D-manno-heptose 6-epimerase